MGKLRVLNVVQSLDSLGGLERYVERLARRLEREGHASTAIQLERTRPQDVLAEALRWKADVVLSHQAGEAAFLREIAARLPLAVFVHTTLCPSGKLFRRGDTVCGHAMGTRCLVDWYAGPCGSSPSPVRALTQINASRRKASAICDAHAAIVATYWMRRHVIEEGAAADRVHLCDVREGVAPPKPPRAVRDASKPRLLFVGRVVYGKGAQYVVEALRHLPVGAKLRVVGDGWYLPELKAIARRLGVADRVSFDGAVDEAAVEAAYEAADVLVVPSVWPEPAGLVVPEGRARGLPVVVFDRGGLGEWRTTYELDGVHVAERVDAASLSATISEALARPSQLALTTQEGTFEPMIDVLHIACHRFAQTALPSHIER